MWLGAEIDGYFDKWVRRWYSTHIFDVNVCEHGHYRLLSILFLSAVRSLALSLTHWHKHTPASRQCHLSGSYRAENRSSAVTHVWLNMKSPLPSLNILLILNTSLGLVDVTTASLWFCLSRSVHSGMFVYMNQETRHSLQLMMIFHQNKGFV